MSENEKLNGKKVFLLKKKYIIVLSAIVLVIIIAVSVFLTASSADEISIFYSGAQSGAVTVYGDRLSDGVLSGKSVASVRYSQKSTSAAVLMSEGSSYTLYYTDGRKNVKIADSCTNDYVISLDGKKVMYINSMKELYVFDVEKEKNVQVDSSAGKFCLSPSGKYAVYIKNDIDGEKMYLYNGSVSAEFSTAYIPLSVSDDGGFIFALNNDNSLYVLDKSGNITAKICSSVSAEKFSISSDMKSIVFNDGNYTYISHEGKSRVRIIPHEASPAGIVREISCDSSCVTSVCSSLTDIYYSAANETDDYTLFYFDANSDRADVTGNVSKYVFTDNGKLVYLTSEGKICIYEKGKSVVAASGATDILSDSKGRFIYYTDAAQTLYVLKNGTSVMLASGVEKISMTHNDTVLFVMTDGRLYSVRRDNRAEFVDENVYGCVCNDSATFYVKNYSSHTGKFELYASESARNFSLIHENISCII